MPPYLCVAAMVTSEAEDCGGAQVRRRNEKRGFQGQRGLGDARGAEVYLEADAEGGR
jgi:hypothetical protein